WNVCGDGAVYVEVTNNANPNALEECDDANSVETDSCLSSCEYNVCADGVVLEKHSEPYDDPDGTGPMTASRGGYNNEYHCRDMRPAAVLTPGCLVETINGLVPRGE